MHAGASSLARIHSGGAICDDYAAMVDFSDLRDEAERRRLQEASENLEPNETYWVNLMSAQLFAFDHIVKGLRAGAHEVLASKTGEAVFPAQPPEAPDAPPS